MSDVSEKDPKPDITAVGGPADATEHDGIDPRREAALLRKIDLHLMLPLWVIFVFGFLDRINLGNVAVLGIFKELHLTGTEFSIAMQIFFVPYILLDIPSNILLKRVAPSTWISALTFLWGMPFGVSVAVEQGRVRHWSEHVADL